jgi:hypothetical protein
MSYFLLDHRLASGHNRKEFLKSDTSLQLQALDSLLLMRGIYSVVGGLTPLRHNHLGWVHQLGHAILCESFEILTPSYNRD